MANWLDKYDVGGNLDPLGLATVKKDATQLAAPKLKLTKAQLEKNKAINKQVMANTKKAEAKAQAEEARARTEEVKARRNRIATANAMQDKQFDSAENFAIANSAIGDKLRFSEYPNIFDDYINPASMVGDMASGLGQIPLNIKQGNYGEAAMNIANPIITGLGERIIDPIIAAGLRPITKPIKDNAQKLGKSVVSSLANAINPSASQVSRSEIFNQLVHEAAGRIPGIKKQVTKEVDKGNAWLKDWINHPTTQQKINKDFNKYYNDKGYVDIPTFRQQQAILGYKPDVQLYPLKNQFRDFIDLARGNKAGGLYPDMIHSGNSGVSYTHSTPHFTTPYHERYGEWVSASPSYTPEGRTSTTIHEGTHGWIRKNTFEDLGIDDKVLDELNPLYKEAFLKKQSLESQGYKKDQIKKIMGDEMYNFGYLAKPTEVHARTMQIRKAHGLTPDDVITPKDWSKIYAERGAFNTTNLDPNHFELFKSPESAAKIMNELWAVPPVIGAGVVGANMLGQGTPQQEMQRNGGELDKYNDGGELNYNDSSVSFPPNYVGQAYDITGRDYSPAWGGQFEDGGELPKAQDGWLDKIDNVMSAPARGATWLATKALTGKGKYVDPSEAMNIQNPYAKMAVDMVFDPTNLLGVGLATKLGKIAKGVKVLNKADNIIEPLSDGTKLIQRIDNAKRAAWLAGKNVKTKASKIAKSMSDDKIISILDKLEGNYPLKSFEIQQALEIGAKDAKGAIAFVNDLINQYPEQAAQIQKVAVNKIPGYKPTTSSVQKNNTVKTKQTKSVTYPKPESVPQSTIDWMGGNGYAQDVVPEAIPQQSTTPGAPFGFIEDPRSHYMHRYRTTTGELEYPFQGGQTHVTPQMQDGGKVCDSCQKAQEGKKISGDEKRKKVLAKAEEIFANSANPYTIPEDIVKAGGNSNYVCIQGVCGILSDSGIIPKDYYTNTKFAEKAKDLGFGRAMADISLLKPGDVVQHMSDQNESGTRFPSHAEIFKRINPDTGEYEFYDYFDKYNGLGGIRSYSKDELEQRFNRFKNRDNSGIQAQFFSLDPESLPKAVPQPFPYNLPEKEQEQYFDATHAANTQYFPGEAAQGPILDVPSYERSQMKHGLAALFNDKDLDKKLRKELKITDQDLQKAKPLIYGIMDQETDFGNPRSPAANIKYGLKELLGSGKYSMGPAAVRYDEALSPEAKKAFGIEGPHDLSKVKNAYIGALDVLSKGARYTDNNISGHPFLEDKDSMERALYWYNNPGNVVRSDAQNFQALQKQANHLWFDAYNPDNGRLGTFEDRFDVMGRAYRSPLRMDAGSYPDKVIKQSNALHKVIDFEDMNVLPEVQVTNYSEEPFAMGGSLPGSVGFMYARTGAPSKGPRRNQTSVTDASAQDGTKIKTNIPVPIDELKKANASAEAFNKQYVQSPNFVNLLQKQGYTPKEIKRRQDEVLGMTNDDYTYTNFGPNFVYGEDESGKTKINYNQRGLGDWSNFGDIAAHEWGHVGVTDYGPSALKSSEQKLLYSKLNWPNVSENPDDFAHDIAPQENRADLVELRKALQDRGIYDSFKGGEFKQEHLDKLREKDPEYWNRSMRLYKDKDIVDLMNTIAANNPKQGMPVAQNGYNMSYYQNGLDFKPKSISKNGKKIIKDDRGQWAHPGEITEIGSNQITMQGVPYPVLGISDTGDMQMMYPNQDYIYHGSSVTEYPMMKEGGALQLTKLDQLTNFTNYNTKQPGGWLDKYQD